MSKGGTMRCVQENISLINDQIFGHKEEQDQDWKKELVGINKRDENALQKRS